MMVENLLIRIRNTELVRKNLALLNHVYYFLQYFNIKKELKINLSLKDRYLGKRCLIFGTGTSINEINLHKFKEEYTFACNSFFLHHDFEMLDLSFFAMVDGIYGLWKSHIPWDKPTIFFPKLEKACKTISTIFFFNISTKRFIKKNGLFLNRPVHYMVKNGHKKENSLTSLSLHARNDFLIGALPFMIAASIYMGFKELYLFGTGFTYEPTQHGHFYDPQRVLEEAKTWKNTQIDERHYDIKSIAERNGVKIFNVVPEGFESPVYEKVSLEDVYQLLRRQR